MDISQLRRQMRNERRQLSKQTLRQHSLQLLHLTSNLKIFRHSHRIAFYLASRGEIDPQPLLDLALQVGKLAYLPTLRARPGNGLWFTSFNHETRLIKNRFGIPEPSLQQRNITMPWALDIIFLPLVAFDTHGNRLGMGGGFYDRTLAFRRHRNHWQGPKLIGLAHDFQCVSTLPKQPWDIPLDAVITEQCIYTFESI
jgi:5-formyltetrahydrofolate cyclo-ligase